MIVCQFTGSYVRKLTGEQLLKELIADDFGLLTQHYHFSIIIGPTYIINLLNLLSM